MSNRAPGADDDGSGVVVMLEALRVLPETAFQPRSTVEFHFNAAEEDGLRGSDEVFREYIAENQHVLAMLQQDMSGDSPSGIMSIVTDSDLTHRGLSDFILIIATEYMSKHLITTNCLATPALIMLALPNTIIARKLLSIPSSRLIELFQLSRCLGYRG